MRSRAPAKGKLSPQDEYFHQRLDGFFSPSWIKKTARETGLVKRLRTFNPVLFFWILVLQKGVVLQGNMEAVRRKYNEYALEETLSHAAFYDRFTPQLVKFLHASALRALEKLGELRGRKLSDRLAGFKDILIQDSTIIRLHEKLHKIFPATRSRKKNQAGAKLSVVVSVKQDGPKTVRLFGERTSEAKTMRVGPWVKGRILLIDLGFYKYLAFTRIKENGGFFVSRLKDNANPLITKLTRHVRGNSVPVEGEHLRDVLPNLQREVLDVEAEVTFRRRSYGGKRSGDEGSFRVVAIMNDETGEYHTYITNLTSEQFTAEEIASLYRARWEIELIFRELKSVHALDQIPTSNKRAVEAMIWTSILTLVVHRVLFLTAAELNPERAPYYSHERAAKTFRESTATALLAQVLDRHKIKWSLADVMTMEDCGAFNPHRETSVHIKAWRS